MTCFEDFVPNIDDQLNATQIEHLKYLLLQLFFFEYTYQMRILVDVRVIHQYIIKSKLNISFFHFLMKKRCSGKLYCFALMYVRLTVSINEA